MRIYACILLLQQTLSIAGDPGRIAQKMVRKRDLSSWLWSWSLGMPTNSVEHHELTSSSSPDCLGEADKWHWSLEHHEPCPFQYVVLGMLLEAKKERLAKENDENGSSNSGLKRFFKKATTIVKPTKTTMFMVNSTTRDKQVYLPEDLPLGEEFYDILETTTVTINNTRQNGTGFLKAWNSVMQMIGIKNNNSSSKASILDVSSNQLTLTPVTNEFDLVQTSISQTSDATELGLSATRTLNDTIFSETNSTFTESEEGYTGSLLRSSTNSTNFTEITSLNYEQLQKTDISENSSLLDTFSTASYNTVIPQPDYQAESYLATVSTSVLAGTENQTLTQEPMTWKTVKSTVNNFDIDLKMIPSTTFKEENFTIGWLVSNTTFQESPFFTESNSTVNTLVNNSSQNLLSPIDYYQNIDNITEPLSLLNFTGNDGKEIPRQMYFSLLKPDSTGNQGVNFNLSNVYPLKEAFTLEIQRVISTTPKTGMSNFLRSIMGRNTKIAKAGQKSPSRNYGHHLPLQVNQNQTGLMKTWNSMKHIVGLHNKSIASSVKDTNTTNMPTSIVPFLSQENEGEGLYVVNLTATSDVPYKSEAFINEINLLTTIALQIERNTDQIKEDMNLNDNESASQFGVISPSTIPSDRVFVPQSNIMSETLKALKYKFGKSLFQTSIGKYVEAGTPNIQSDLEKPVSYLNIYTNNSLSTASISFVPGFTTPTLSATVQQYIYDNEINSINPEGKMNSQLYENCIVNNTQKCTYPEDIRMTSVTPNARKLDLEYFVKSIVSKTIYKHQKSKTKRNSSIDVRFFDKKLTTSRIDNFNPVTVFKRLKKVYINSKENRTEQGTIATQSKIRLKRNPIDFNLRYGLYSLNPAFFTALRSRASVTDYWKRLGMNVPQRRSRVLLKRNAAKNCFRTTNVVKNRIPACFSDR